MLYRCPERCESPPTFQEHLQRDYRVSSPRTAFRRVYQACTGLWRIVSISHPKRPRLAATIDIAKDNVLGENATLKLEEHWPQESRTTLRH